MLSRWCPPPPRPLNLIAKILEESLIVLSRLWIHYNNYLYDRYIQSSGTKSFPGIYMIPILR